MDPNDAAAGHSLEAVPALRLPESRAGTEVEVQACPPAVEYAVDLAQRMILFLDILRERADNMLAHEAAGLPPVLHFEYEAVLDARSFPRPCNYQLLKITRCGSDHLERLVRADARPVIVVDPRAGHGPGIGGFKRDSEVGVALRLGHPVYFVAFTPDPWPGQTLGDVLAALRRFVTEVIARHPGRPPALYGNCQAGWAVALLSADCQGLAGPAVLSGSPLSYWAGEADVNPMRLAGGLLGGAWLTHFLADIGDGRFDGAWLAGNFELLKPGETLWEKYDRVFVDPQAERERFLAFERWWGGYYFLSREEIVAIVENLFIGNRLETGQMKVCDCCTVDMRRVRNPLVIFASRGDDITPPHQALHWIGVLYPSTAELEAAGQRIVYLIDDRVGHLGIFVSASIALREHQAILATLDKIETLGPGLYEMVIDGAAGLGEAKLERRRVEDLDFSAPNAPFERVQNISEQGVQLYEQFLGPSVRAAASPWSAEVLKWLHPMRLSRWMFSPRFNPWMSGVEWMASSVAEKRRPAASDNPFILLERLFCNRMLEVFERWRSQRDASYEMAFRFWFGSGDRGKCDSPGG